ncbi:MULTISPECIES: YjbF family lipoprotein [Vibrio]|uniref:YjbF family lipoprotein n=1 Tax=Vibrio TaxID=662 RepID=UPI0009413F8E|nr:MULTISPECIES: YjbF family lipoprotein [Vibrio]MCG6244197.1 YjbF family lipoprotein [Vibrio diabolicus]MCQ9065892.1 YjbF family lipoprotein [Vibrio diabolicus]MCS0355081.1 YjbF family lipoprotein [Vibrio diabolicus]MCZ0924069.1 YjbF family lipoprotein [Vibrio diabolicus]OKQ13600.1 regulator [Vibrio antiquarius]
MGKMRSNEGNTQSKLLIITSILLMAGCTQKFNDVSATVEEAYSNYIDVELTSDEIKQVPYASAYLRIGSQKQVFVVLAFAEENKVTGTKQLKWVSADKSMIVTENGRIIKTIGLQKNNLVAISGTYPKFNEVNTIHSYSLTYDWMPKYRYNYSATAQLSKSITSTVETALYNSPAQIFEESIYFKALDSKITNRYWVDTSGNVLKTRQYLGPNMEPIEITFLKRYTEKK